MFAAMMAVVWTALGWVFRSVVFKFVVVVVIFWIISELAPVLGSLLPTIGFGDTFTVIDPGVWFFLDFFQIPTGVSMLLSAYVTRFLIRRIPFIG